MLVHSTISNVKGMSDCRGVISHVRPTDRDDACNRLQPDLWSEGLGTSSHRWTGTVAQILISILSQTARTSIATRDTYYVNDIDEVVFFNSNQSKFSEDTSERHVTLV